MASQNLNVGTGANANDGDTLRAAFIKVRKMFAEVYGQTYVDDTTEIPSADFKIDASRMETTNTPASGLDGYVMTYDHSSGGFTFEEYFNGDITRVQGGSGLSGDTQSGDATISIDLNDLTEAALDVANDDIAFVDTSDSNTTRKESIADLMDAVAGDGISATNGVLNVSVNTDQIGDNQVTPPKLDQFDDSLTAATSGDILVSNGTDFIHATMSGDATIASGGALTIEDDAVDYDKLAGEFTTSSALTAAADLDIDFSSAAVFTTTSSIAVDLNFTNAEVGQVKTIIVTDSGGTSSLTFDTATNTVTTLNGEYDATAGAVNFIQAICTASNTFFVTISQ